MRLQLHPAGGHPVPDTGGDAPAMSSGTWSPAKLTMVGTLGAAIVTGVFTIAPQLIPLFHDKVEQTPSSISYDYTGDYTKAEVTVGGSASKDVDEVAVLVGPRSSGGAYWAKKVKVVDGAWDVTIETDPSLPKPYTVQAIPHSGHRNSALGANTVALYSFSSGETTTPPAPSQDLLQCAQLHGASCFEGPGWGTPVTRESDG